MFHENRFISASEDGLISVFDLSTGFDEDQGFMVQSLPIYNLCVGSAI